MEMMRLKAFGCWCLLAVLVAGCKGLAPSRLADSLADRAYNKMLEKADEKKETFHFHEAYELYSTVALDLHDRAQTDSTIIENTEVYRNAVDCAIRSGNLKAASDLVDTLIVSGMADQQDWNQRVNLALNLGDDVAAKAILESAAQEFPGKPWIDEMLAGIEELKQFHEIDVVAEVWPFRVNADNMEFGAVAFGDEVVFVSAGSSTDMSAMADGWTGRKFAQIVSVPLADSSARAVPYARAQLSGQAMMSTVIQNDHDGPASFSPDGLRMYVTRNHATSVQNLEGQDTRNLKVEVFEREPGKKWKLAANQLPFNHPNYSVLHAVEDTAGNVIFSSNMPGSRGGLDLWVSEVVNGEYGQPRNLGEKVNTRGDETFPFVDGVNQLYYSTNGRRGLGGLDVYRHDMASGLTELLGQPINSFADDFAFNVNDEGEGFVSSNRVEEVDRLYRVQMGDIVAQFEIELVACDGTPLSNEALALTDEYTDAQTKVMSDSRGVVRFDAPLGHRMSLGFMGNDAHDGFVMEGLRSAEKGLVRQTNVLDYKNPTSQLQVRLDPDREIREPLSVTFFDDEGGQKTMLTDLNGRLEWSVTDMMAYTSIKVDHIGYRTGTSPLVDESACPKGRTITMTLSKQVEIDLDLIYYDLDEASLRDASRQELDKLIRYMKEVPYVKVELSSHTDARGTKEYNEQLSQARAQKCVDYIISQGIPATRIEAAGYGESQPLNKCVDGVWCNERMHQENRRTELRFLAD